MVTDHGSLLKALGAVNVPANAAIKRVGSSDVVTLRVSTGGDFFVLKAFPHDVEWSDPQLVSDMLRGLERQPHRGLLVPRVARSATAVGEFSTVLLLSKVPGCAVTYPSSATFARIGRAARTLHEVLASNAFDVSAPQRIHGDLHVGNVLLTEDDVGFIDFDEARIGSPLDDVASLIGFARAPDFAAEVNALLDAYCEDLDLETSHAVRRELVRRVADRLALAISMVRNGDPRADRARHEVSRLHYAESIQDWIDGNDSEWARMDRL